MIKNYGTFNSQMLETYVSKGDKGQSGGSSGDRGAGGLGGYSGIVRL
jgi:hypothetical protein